MRIASHENKERGIPPIRNLTNLLLRGIGRLAAMEEAMVDVGPELFGNKRRSIDSNIQAPLSACVRKATFARGVVEMSVLRTCITKQTKDMRYSEAER